MAKNPKTKLTDKQTRFVEEYLVDLNATKAAIRAGYSPKTAYSIASIYLKKPEILAALQRARDAQQRRTQITADRVLEEYAKIAFADPRRLFNGDERIALSDLDDSIAGAIAGADLAEITSEQGKTVVGFRYKLADKVRALDALAKHLGLFDNQKKDGDDDGVKVIIDV